MSLPATRARLRRVSAIAAALFALPLIAIEDAAAATQYPLTLENCGRTITFDSAPGRVVSIGQGSTEILLSLGLADRMVGTAVWFGPVLSAHAEANAGIPRLADNDPSFESVVAREPELVAATFEWHVGANGSVGTRDQFAELGIPTYISPADCAAKDNTAGGDGVRKELFTMALIYQEIAELAAIFDVAERGAALVDELRAREAAATASVAAAGARDVSVMFWFSSPEVDGDAYLAGKNGAPAYILKTLGATNVITTEEEWPLVSWESIAAADPDVIVVAEMDRRRYGADDVATKLLFLETDPVASQLTAVREKRIVAMDSQAMSATIRTTDGIEALAAGIAAFGLGQ